MSAWYSVGWNKFSLREGTETVSDALGSVALFTLNLWEGQLGQVGCEGSIRSRAGWQLGN